MSSLLSCKFNLECVLRRNIFIIIYLMFMEPHLLLGLFSFSNLFMSGIAFKKMKINICDYVLSSSIAYTF